METKELYDAIREELNDIKHRLDNFEKSFDERIIGLDLNKNFLLSRFKLNLNINQGNEIKNQFEDERIEKGSVLITDQEPVTYHSLTRKRCEYKIVQREIRVHPEIITSKLNFREAVIVEFTASGSIKAQFEAALKIKATAELLSAWQAVTGSPIPANVRIGTAVEASIAASMAAQIVLNMNIRLIRYTFVIDGVIQVRLVARIKELWDWVGEDCNNLGISPDPKVQEYELKDAQFKEIPIEPLRFTYWEITSPGIAVLGRKWAENERNKDFREKLQQSWESGALRSVPLPQFMPSTI